MRLLKISIQNWRGVDTRDVQFASGVTLIEGPNEIGKSTIVEALRMLFYELDSSNKKSVKAIQPVGQDVGSRVEAEVRVGEHHFVYAKTYNKGKQTTLDILAPRTRQLTGRQAHEAVEQMLAESVDLLLWDALLVDQGEKVAPANLQASTGLAQALDEAAGSASAGLEDTDLYSAVQAEYEKYFTLKTARPKFAQQEKDFAAARAALAEAKTVLDAVEDDSNAYERIAGEVRRLRAELPNIQASLHAHERKWRTVNSLQDTVAAKLKELAAAQTIAQAAQDNDNQRTELAADIEASQQRLAAETAAQAPLRAQTATLKERIANAQRSITELKQQLKNAQRTLDLAQGDARYVHDLETVAREKVRLEQLRQIAESMRSHLAVTAAISVDAAAVASLREAESRLAIALGTRNAAATTVSVTARQDTKIEIDGDAVALELGATETRSVASALALRFPGVADIRIVPSRSVAELEEQTQDAREALATLAARYGVKNLEAAVTANQQRADAQREVDRLKGREEELLQQSNREELAVAVGSLQAQCDRYLQQRESIADLPANTAAAQNRLTDAQSALGGAQAILDAAQERVQALQLEHDQHDNRLRLAQQELAGLQAALNDKRERLEKERASNPDDALAERATRAIAHVEALRAEVSSLQASLDDASPEAVQALLSNAKDACERASKELQQAEQNLAVSSDRLQQAQADGRFEAVEAARRHFEASNAALNAVQRRSKSAARLWNTLNRHRDAAREAYVRPLKEAIDRLGVIVFGAGFQISIGDDWSLRSRTLDGKTLPFDDLSVGAKEQIGILTRLAAAQIVSRQGGVPLIIDDALGFSDPSRLETMGAAIAAAGKQCQIIILTCAPGRFTNVGNAAVVRF